MHVFVMHMCICVRSGFYSLVLLGCLWAKCFGFILSTYSFSVNVSLVSSKHFRFPHLEPLVYRIDLQETSVLMLPDGSSVNVTLYDANHCPGGKLVYS